MTDLAALLVVKDLIIDLFSRLDPTSRRRLFAVSKGVCRQLAPLLTSITLSLPSSILQAKRIDYIISLATVCMPSSFQRSVVLIVEHDIADSSGPDRQWLPSDTLVKAFRALGCSADDAVLQRFHQLTICDANLDVAVAAAIRDAWGPSWPLHTLHLKRCGVNPWFFGTFFEDLRGLTVDSCMEVSYWHGMSERLSLMTLTSLRGLESLTIRGTQQEDFRGAERAKLYSNSWRSLTTLVIKEWDNMYGSLTSSEWKQARYPSVWFLQTAFPILRRLSIPRLRLADFDFRHASCTWTHLTTHHIVVGQRMSPLYLWHEPPQDSEESWPPPRVMLHAYGDTTTAEVQTITERLLSCPALPGEVVLGVSVDTFHPCSPEVLAPLLLLKGRVSHLVLTYGFTYEQELPNVQGDPFINVLGPLLDDQVTTLDLLCRAWHPRTVKYLCGRAPRLKALKEIRVDASSFSARSKPGWDGWEASDDMMSWATRLVQKLAGQVEQFTLLYHPSGGLKADVCASMTDWQLALDDALNLPAQVDTSLTRGEGIKLSLVPCDHVHSG